MKNLNIFLRRYTRNKIAVVGFVILFFFLFIALFGNFISIYDPFQIGAGEVFEPPSKNHIMGTDDFGRDVFSWVISGARTSLTVGFLAVGLSTLFGTMVGAISAYFGGIVDDILQRFTEIFLVIPRLFLALVLVSIIGASIWNVIVAIGILSWPRIARICRAEFLSIKERSYIEAARTLGESDLYIIFREILPNALPPIIVTSSLMIGSAISIESGLSFLGLGDPTNPSWGLMLKNAQYFLRRAWWMSVFPGIAIFLTVLSINLVGDGLNDALNPKEA